MQSNSLRIEDSSAGVLMSKAIEAEVEVAEINNEANVNNEIDQDEVENVIFLINSAGSDPTFEETNKEDDSMNDEADINVGDVNVPANGIINKNTTNTEGNASQSYYQKLEVKRNMTKELVGAIITKN